MTAKTIETFEKLEAAMFDRWIHSDDAFTRARGILKSSTTQSFRRAVIQLIDEQNEPADIIEAAVDAIGFQIALCAQCFAAPGLIDELVRHICEKICESAQIQLTENISVDRKIGGRPT